MQYQSNQKNYSLKTDVFIIIYKSCISIIDYMFGFLSIIFEFCYWNNNDFVFEHAVFFSPYNKNVPVTCNAIFMVM